MDRRGCRRRGQGSNGRRGPGQPNAQRGRITGYGRSEDVTRGGCQRDQARKSEVGRHRERTLAKALWRVMECGLRGRLLAENSCGFAMSAGRRWSAPRAERIPVGPSLALPLVLLERPAGQYGPAADACGQRRASSRACPVECMSSRHSGQRTSLLPIEGLLSWVG